LAESFFRVYSFTLEKIKIKKIKKKKIEKKKIEKKAFCALEIQTYLV
jgi:hypothetical protein